MPAVDYPRSDLQRHALLRACSETGKKQADMQVNYLSADMLAAVDAFLTMYTPLITVVEQALGARSKEIGEKQAALVRLEMVMRDFWEVLKRRTYRRDDPVAIFEIYGLPLDGTVPNPTTEEDWLALAEKLIASDARAVAAGYLAMTNPAAAELQIVLNNARKEGGEAVVADALHSRAQQAAAARRIEADQLVIDVIDELKYSTRRLEPSTQRRFLRLYGVNFRYLPGEPVDEAAGAEPAPTQG